MPHEVSANQVLANEALAPLPEVALSEPDYRAFCAALEASARGRAFLAEFARRNRHADTATVLAALDRLEAQVARQSAGSDADRIRHAIGAPADPVVTASVGVTSVGIARFRVAADDPVTLLETIVERADHAMFDAKRNGGNATFHLPPVDATS